MHTLLFAVREGAVVAAVPSGTHTGGAGGFTRHALASAGAGAVGAVAGAPHVTGRPTKTQITGTGGGGWVARLLRRFNGLFRDGALAMATAEGGPLAYTAGRALEPWLTHAPLPLAITRVLAAAMPAAVILA